jgi:ABC-type glycerol-3-phosphate transport system permease component
MMRKERASKRKAFEARVVGTKERNWWVYIVLAVLSLVCIMPFLWVVLTAFKDRITAFSVPPTWLFSPTIDSFITLVKVRRMHVYLFNSVIISLASTILSVGIGTFAAYALARFRFAGRDDLAFWILTNRMLPPVAVLIPMFMIFQTVHLLDRHIGLIILYTGMQLPFVVWMLRGYFEDIPRQLEEAAWIDGDTWLAAFRKITLPLVSPAITATGIFVLILCWNEYAFALYITGPNSKTLPPSVMTFMVERSVEWNQLGAACVFIALPILIFVLFVQKHFVRGLSMGMIKQEQQQTPSE